MESLAEKSVVIFLLLSCLFASVIQQTIENEFKNFIIKHKKDYKIGSPEYFRRLKVFVHNVGHQRKLNGHRSHNDSAVYGITKFADLTETEFKEKFLHPLVFNATTHKDNKAPVLMYSFKAASDIVPDKVDWRTKNVVTAVQNQKQCGSCWAFAVTETIESSYALGNGSLLDLSEQEMMDCSVGFEDTLNGCSGGDTCTALNWMKTTKAALVSESAYPVTDQQQPCNMKPSSVSGVRVKDFTCYNYSTDEDKVLEMIAKSPIAAAVDATTWNNYLGGIIQFHCGTSLNHAVEIVGYDKSADIPHYIAKNSWGTDWGDQGYVYLSMYSDVCGISSRVSSVTPYMYN